MIFLDCYYCCCFWPRVEWEYCVRSCCPTIIPSNLSYYVLFALIMSHTLQVSTLKYDTIHWIPRIGFSFITWQGVDVKQLQFPVRLCFAMTVHSSQTLNRVVFDAGMFLCTDAYTSAYLGGSAKQYYSRKSVDIEF